MTFPAIFQPKNWSKYTLYDRFLAIFEIKMSVKRLVIIQLTLIIVNNKKQANSHCFIRSLQSKKSYQCSKVKKTIFLSIFEPILAHFRLLSPLQKVDMTHFHSSTRIPIYFAFFVIFCYLPAQKIVKIYPIGPIFAYV